MIPFSKGQERSELPALLLELPTSKRAFLVRAALAFAATIGDENVFQVGVVHSLLSDRWENSFGEPLPVAQLRSVLEPPLAIRIVMEFNKLGWVDTREELNDLLDSLLQHLRVLATRERGEQQLPLFDDSTDQHRTNGRKMEVGQCVRSLSQLTQQGHRFPTIYADPPWDYDNSSSRGAAINHYPTMSLEEICAEPVRELAAENAHLHLWTTNAFLRPAYDVLDAWGFEFKSCFVWVKQNIGMGNYWRVSHEFLLLGVRGNLTFRDRTQASWIGADRSSHSRKPAVVRALIEKVSPGPYLELYGREALPDSAWTVYGNQVEPRLF